MGLIVPQVPVVPLSSHTVPVPARDGAKESAQSESEFLEKMAAILRGCAALVPRLSRPSAQVALLPLATPKWKGCVVVRSYFTSGREQRLFSRMKTSNYSIPCLARHMSSLPPHVPLSMPALSPTMTAGNIGNVPKSSWLFPIACCPHGVKPLHRSLVYIHGSTNPNEVFFIWETENNIAHVVTSF